VVARSGPGWVGQCGDRQGLPGLCRAK
jgi:hypothetical protein